MDQENQIRKELVDQTKKELVSLSQLFQKYEEFIKCALQEYAHKLAQDALRSEADLRNQLRRHIRAQEVATKQQIIKAKSSRSRAAKRLDNCPGINNPSASGKRILPLDSYWVKETGNVKKEEITTPTLKTRDVTGTDGAMAGLQGLNSTFSFSPRELREMKAGELLVFSGI